MSDYIPIEVVTEILKWLPVKSLMRFRCVCKTWDLLITSSDFLSLHLNGSHVSYSGDNARILVRHYSQNRRSEVYTVHPDNDKFEENQFEIEFPFKGQSRYCFRIVGFCNGILCLSNDDMFGYTNSVILWNPSIRRYLSVPGQSSRSENNGVEVFVFGFGVVARTNDLKVVKIRYYHQEDDGFLVPSEVEIYEVGSLGWRRIQAPIPYPIVEHFWSHAYTNGFCHWIAYHVYKKNEVRTFRNLILSFDLGNEDFCELNLPEPLKVVSPLKLSITMFGGFLSVFQYNRQSWVNSCSIWVMQEYGNDSSWTNQFNIDLDGRLGTVLSLRRKGDILLAGRNGGLLSYNQENKMTTSLGFCGTKDSFYVDSYRESLILLTEGRMVRGRDAGSGESDSDESGSEDDHNQDRTDSIALMMQLAIDQFFSAFSHV